MPIAASKNRPGLVVTCPLDRLKAAEGGRKLNTEKAFVGQLRAFIENLR